MSIFKLRICLYLFKLEMNVQLNYRHQPTPCTHVNSYITSPRVLCCVAGSSHTYCAVDRVRVWYILVGCRVFIIYVQETSAVMVVSRASTYGVSTLYAE